MTGKKLYEEFLRQLPHNGVANPQFPRRYLLSTTQENGQRLQGCQQLLLGDRMTLGNNGAEFIFERQLKHQSTQQSSRSVPRAAIGAGSQPIPTPLPLEHSVSFSQLFPILSTGRDLNRKAYLIPGILTGVFVVLMFATVGQPEAAYQKAS